MKPAPERKRPVLRPVRDEQRRIWRVFQHARPVMPARPRFTT
jgi:hypothetical protein